MPMTKDDIDSFYEYATEQLGDDSAQLSLEECVLRWRFRRAEGSVDVQPFPNGETLLDRLKAAGVVGRKKDGPADLSTNPKYMEGFGQSSMGEKE